MRESPIFLKSFETIEWLLARTRQFPRHQRFVMAKRIEDAALSFHDSLVLAVKQRERQGEALGEADYHLERLKVYSRLSLKLQLITFAQYEFLAGRLDELGRLLGGWLRRGKGSVVHDGGGMGVS